MGKFDKQQFFINLFEVTFYSLTVIFITSIFTGSVLTIQTHYGLTFLASSERVAEVVTDSIITELGPVLVGLMIAGKVSSFIASQISTMNSTDQIEALKTLSIRPVEYLMRPYFLACTIAVPILLLIGYFISFLGSSLIVSFKYNFDFSSYLSHIINHITLYKLAAGFTKAVLFGAIIGFVSSYIGINAKKGTKGVGQATTNAVVVSSIGILITNFIITSIFFGV